MSVHRYICCWYSVISPTAKLRDSWNFIDTHSLVCLQAVIHLGYDLYIP